MPTGSHPLYATRPSSWRGLQTTHHHEVVWTRQPKWGRRCVNSPTPWPTPTEEALT